MSQREQHQAPETEAAKWNSAIISFIIYTCDFPTVTSQNVFWEFKSEKKMFLASLTKQNSTKTVSFVIGTNKQTALSTILYI